MSTPEIDHARLARMARLRNIAYSRMTDAYGDGRDGGSRADRAEMSAARRDFLDACTEFLQVYHDWLSSTGPDS